MGVLIFDKGIGRQLKEVREERSVDQICRRDCSNSVYSRGRWSWRCDSGDWCDNNRRGKVLDGDILIGGEGGEWATFDNVWGIGGGGRDWAGEFINETILSRGEVLVVDSSRVGELDDQIVEVVAGKLLSGNISEDVEEGLVVDEGGR